MGSWLLGWAIGLGSAALLFIALLHLVVALVLIVPSWRILTRAGYAGPLSLFHLLPVLGSFIVMAILAFGEWPNGEARPGEKGRR
jgi:sorbitol-specific phosphotransferase system component IIC